MYGNYSYVATQKHHEYNNRISLQKHFNAMLLVRDQAERSRLFVLLHGTTCPAHYVHDYIIVLAIDEVTIAWVLKYYHLR